MRELEAAGAVVCGVSVNGVESHAEFARKYNLPYALLADHGGNTARRFGSLHNFGLLKFARRNTFLFDAQGCLVKTYLGVNPAQNARAVLADLGRLVK